MVPDGGRGVSGGGAGGVRAGAQPERDRRGDLGPFSSGRVVVSGFTEMPTSLSALHDGTVLLNEHRKQIVCTWLIKNR